MMDKCAQAERIIAQKLPGLQSNQPVYDALLRFFGDGALIATDLSDLDSFLRPDSLYRAIRVQGNTLQACALALLDNYPECTSARGMLRCYEVGPDFWWGECEVAETELGNALTLDIYDWSPDSFTLFNDAPKGTRALIVILAFE